MKRHLICSVAGIFALAGFLKSDQAYDLPDRNNPDYIYVEDFESGREQNDQLPVFSIAGRHGVREGAGWKSRYGFSNVLVENDSLPPYPEVRFPRQTGTLFFQWMVKVPSNFYLGLGDHGYYFFDSQTPKGGGRGVVVDHAPNHMLWFNPEWDPHSLGMLRAGYGRVLRTFEGFEPLERGVWHSYQVMIVPSEKDPAVGRMKYWVDGVLSNFSTHATPPSLDTFWISNYWHSWEYVPKDQYSNLFEAHTAPLHPAFEILLDNLIVSKQFVEIGSNKPQIERLRMTELASDALTLWFDSTVEARRAVVLCGADGDNWLESAAEYPVTSEDNGYFHQGRIAGLETGKKYRMQARVEDVKGRTIESEILRFAMRPDSYPELLAGPVAPVTSKDSAGRWRGEVFGNIDFEGAPIMVRNFNSLSFIAWPGHDAELGINTAQSLSIRYTKQARFDDDDYVFYFVASDGLRVMIDDEVLFERKVPTAGHRHERFLRRKVAAGEHELTVEHRIWREQNWEEKANKYLALSIFPESAKTPPVCLSQGIYNTRFHKPAEPVYYGRWSSDDLEFALEYGETPNYGQTAKGAGRLPRIRLGTLEIGKQYHWRITATDGLGNHVTTPDATFVCGDTIPPRKTLCRLKRVSDTALELTFNAPGEDGKHGAAAAYDIRWSDKPLTIHNWDTATRLPNPPMPQKAKTEETVLLEDLPRGQTWYVAMQAVDQAGLVSLLSNVVSDPPGPEIMDCDGDGYGVGSLLGPDPDDYDATISGAAESGQSPLPWNKP